MTPHSVTFRLVMHRPAHQQLRGLQFPTHGQQPPKLEYETPESPPDTALFVRAALIGIALLGLIFLIGLPFLMHVRDPWKFTPPPTKAVPSSPPKPQSG